MTTSHRPRGFARAATLLRTAALTFVALSATIGLAGCRETRPAVAASAATSDRHQSAPAPGHVHLEELQLEQVRVEQLSSKPSSDCIKLTGTVEFNADRMAKLLPPVPGHVQDLAANVGDIVRRHDVLFVLNSRDVAAATTDHLASHKDLELSEKTFAMTQDLFEHQAASRIALEQATSELAKARARVTQTEEGLQVLGLDPHPEHEPTTTQSRIPVRTPIDGTVIERSVTNGQFVGPENASLVTIADLASVWVQGDIFERDLRHIAIGQYADVTTAAYPTDRFGARVSRVGAVVDSQTRTAKVRFLVANPDGRLKPGMFASIALYLSDSGSSLTVPAKAVFVENGRTFAYVKVGPQEFARREIETVRSDRDRLRVTRGIEAGEHVVSDGVLLLRQLESESESQ
jgi:cobalt-zinc-cadmium efflux system membrane fusion protein